MSETSPMNVAGVEFTKSIAPLSVEAKSINIKSSKISLDSAEVWRKMNVIHDATRAARANAFGFDKLEPSVFGEKGTQQPKELAHDLYWSQGKKDKYWSLARGLFDYHQQLIAFVRTLGRQRSREMALQKIKAETYPKGYDYPIYVIFEKNRGNFVTFFFTQHQANEYFERENKEDWKLYIAIRSIPPENKELRQLLDLIAMVGVTGEVPKT